MLRGVGAAMSLPLLDVMNAPTTFASNTGSARLEGSNWAKATKQNRVAYLYFPNGVSKGSWKPEKVDGDGKIEKLNRWMSPLESLKHQLSIPTNLWTPRGNGHGAGTATWLTGGGYDGRKIDAGGMSVDQIIASKIGSESLLPSLELSVKGEGYFSGDLPRNCISWRNRQTPIARETEPRSVFDLMFRTSDAKGIDRSVVDAVMENARSLQRQGSVEDRRKLDEYLHSVRSIEKRLRFAEKRTEEVVRAGDLTDTLVRPESGIPTEHEKYVRLMLDMIVMAFWSNATRVSTFMLDHGQSNRYFDFIPNCQGTWHALSHYRDISGRTEDDDGKTSWKSLASKRDMYNRITQWHHAQLAYVLNRMQAIQESEGRSLLDNSTIVYGSSISDGHSHGERNLPLLVCGGGGGTLKPGRLIDPKNATSMSRLHLTLLQNMGVNIEAFGETKKRIAI